MEIKDIIRLFCEEEPTDYTVKEIALDDGDSRWVVFAELPEGKFVIKIAANDFTTPERVNGWVKMIEAYRELGYYSPEILRSKNGNYAETAVFEGKSCVVWEEEYAKYRLRSSLDKSVYTEEDGRLKYHDEIFEFLGKIAEKHYDFVTFKSGWARFEPFGAAAETDEVTECLETFDALVREKTPQLIPRWEKIRRLFEENRDRLLEIYAELPTSVFQSDHFGDNLVLDDNGHFKGVIDYNLSGVDTVINVLLYSVLFGYNYYKGGSDGLPEYNRARQDFIIESILDAIKSFRRFYTFNELEAEAILPLYKYISCVEYRQIEAFEKYQADGEKLTLLLDTMENELMRGTTDSE